MVIEFNTVDDLDALVCIIDVIGTQITVAITDFTLLEPLIKRPFTAL